ncbi:hypothetical protein ALQ18_200059 [Pseudomonas marginalis pv. marginalis]|nr:hypothetical protein ALQ18_200059 [Pseudomonas marginalis pv. marginalis]
MCHADDDFFDIEGVEKNSLKFSGFDQKYGGWVDVEFSRADGKIRLYAVPQKNKPLEEGVVASSDVSLMSPDKKYIIVQRTNAGEIVDEQGDSIVSAQAYCDMISLENGCVKNIGSAQQCDGAWVGDNWKLSTGYVFDFSKEGISPSQLISKTSNLSPDDYRSSSLRDWLFMGGESYMACFPPERNISELNDIGYYLAKGGEHLFSIQIYNRLLNIAPGRVPLKLNVADSLWALGRLSEAKTYYGEYRDAMMQKGDAGKIPKRVELRFN